MVEVWRQTPPGRIKTGGGQISKEMTIRNPIVHNMALLLDEIAEADPEMETIRALYMVTQNAHKLILAPHDKE